MEILDIGCGPNKTPNATGIDIHPYDGVDVVHDIQSYPWPLKNNTFDKIVCSHVIEHIDDTVAFMREIHRIAKPNAQVTIITPHFSSSNSWVDPTHKKHFSVQWYKILTEGYLSVQTGRYECLKSEVAFGKSLRAKIGNFLYNWRGPEKWERSYAFIYQGSDITTDLKVIKTSNNT